LYVLEHFSTDLKRLGLCEAVRATCYRTEISVPNFFAIFKLYCPALETFFSPVSELGMALHDIWEVSNLPMVLLPYKEYFHCMMELEQLEKDDPALFETYRESICHFYIYLDVHNARGIMNGMKVWADYLFSVLYDALEEVQFLISEEYIARVMAESGDEDVVLDEDDDIYEKNIGSRAFTTSEPAYA